jgi:uncharacterized protein YndB with AHSA1/START domain
MIVLPPIQTERFYQLPIQDVWEIITTQKYLTQWLMPGTFKPEVGHQHYFQCFPPTPTKDWDGKVHGEVLKVSEPTFIQFTWNIRNLEQPTVVSFKLEEKENGVLFKIEHSGFTKTDGTEHADHVKGWEHHLTMIEKMGTHEKK